MKKRGKTLKKIRSRKHLLLEFENLFNQEIKGSVKKTLSTKNYKKIEEIIKKTPLKQLKKECLNFFEKEFKKRKLMYILIQALGLLIIFLISFGIFLHLIDPKQILTFSIWMIFIFLYLVLDLLSYINTRNKIRKMIEIIEQITTK